MNSVFVASTYKRIIAYWIDSLIVSLFWLPVTVQFVGSWLSQQEFAVEWRWIVLCFILSFAYRWFFLYFLGGTIGKLIMGLRLVNAEDPSQDMSLLQVFLRVLADRLSVFFGFAFQSLMFLRFDRTHLSDWIAETRVVQFTERVKPPQRRPVITLLFFIYFFITGLMGVYKMVQRVEWDQETGTFRGVTYEPEQ